MLATCLGLTPLGVSAQENQPLTEKIALFVQETVETFDRCGDAPEHVPLRPDTTFYGIPHDAPSFTGSDRARLHGIVSAGLRLQDATRVGHAEAVGSLAPVVGNGPERVQSLRDTLNAQARSDFPIILVATRPSPDVAVITLHVFGKAGEGHYVCPASREFVVSLDSKEVTDLPDGSETHLTRLYAMNEVLEDIRHGMQDFEAIDISFVGDRCGLTRDISDELFERWTRALNTETGAVAGRPGLPKFRPPLPSGGVGPGAVEVDLTLDRQSDRLARMRVRGMDGDGNASVHRLYRVLVDPGKGAACRLELEVEQTEELKRLTAEARDAGRSEAVAEAAALAAQTRTLEAELSAVLKENERLSDGAGLVATTLDELYRRSSDLLEEVARDLRASGRTNDAELVLDAISNAQSSDAVIDGFRLAMAAIQDGTTTSDAERRILRKEGCSDLVRTKTTTDFFALELDPGCLSLQREGFRLYLGLHEDHIRTAVRPQDNGRFRLEVPFAFDGAGLGYRTELPDGNGTIALPSVRPGRTHIVLAWGGPVDLDLHVLENEGTRGGEGHVRLDHPGIGAIGIDHSRQTPQSTRFAVYGVDSDALDRIRIGVSLGEGECSDAERQSYRVYKFEDGEPRGTSGRQIVDCSTGFREVTLQ